MQSSNCPQRARSRLCLLPAHYRPDLSAFRIRLQAQSNRYQSAVKKRPSGALTDNQTDIGININTNVNSSNTDTDAPQHYELTTQQTQPLLSSAQFYSAQTHCSDPLLRLRPTDQTTQDHILSTDGTYLARSHELSDNATPCPAVTYGPDPPPDTDSVTGVDLETALAWYTSDPPATDSPDPAMPPGIEYNKQMMDIYCQVAAHGTINAWGARVPFHEH